MVAQGEEVEDREESLMILLACSVFNPFESEITCAACHRYLCIKVPRRLRAASARIKNKYFSRTKLL